MNSINNDIRHPAMPTQDFQINKSENKTLTDETIANQAKTSYDDSSFQGYTLSISEAGRTASSDEQITSLNKPDTDGTVLLNEDDGYVIKTDSSKSTVNLTIYSESELKQMYLNGEITKIEYDEELISRGILE